MASWLVAYGDANYRLSVQRLVASAARHGVECCRPWDREALERTTFYALHHGLLDAPRGSGYWLWKPFIVLDTLRQMAAGDLLIYADAGMDIVADLAPLFDICRTRADILLFAGHYDDVGAPGPNICSKWTKRDCFVGLDCDASRYGDARMVDASLLVVRKTPRTVAFVREWLLWCCQRPLLSDDANVCGLPDGPGFVAHRHDQSILSLLAVREDLELFRHPSQYGNHLKLAPWRVEGEWIQRPYDAQPPYHNSPYGTLVHHHRGELGGLRVDLVERLQAPRELVFLAWSRPETLCKCTPLGRRVLSAEIDVRTGGQYRVAIGSAQADRAFLDGTYLEVDPPSRLVYSWPWDTQVTVDFLAIAPDTTQVTLSHGPFAHEPLWAAHVRWWQEFVRILACDLAQTPA
jgi:uncharacterized protein YndB with AHSA1/START domain